MGDVSFRSRLVEAGLLLETGVDGLYGRSAAYEQVASAVDRLVSETLAEGAPERVHFPPVLARGTFAKTNYPESFPDLMGSVHVFRGDDRAHRELLGRLADGADFQALLEPAEVVLASAACHPLYPMCAGTLPPAGRLFEISGFCFRHEPSSDPARMQAFRMHEVVALGEPVACESHRDGGLKLGLELLESLGLEMSVVPANDPFFGRVGKVLASEQLTEGLKLEGVTDVGGERPTAVISGNCHRDHFSVPFGIELAGGGPAHSACVAFGVDRIALGLFHRHGLDVSSWPSEPRRMLHRAS